MKAPTIVTADPDRGVEWALRLVKHFVRRHARRIAGERMELVPDLIQEGMIGVWEADPSRVDFTDREERRYAYRRIKRRMWSALAREVRARQGPTAGQQDRVHGHAWQIGLAGVGLNGVVRRRAGAE